MRSYLLCAVALLLTGCTSQVSQPGPEGGATIFEGARLITGDGGEAIENSAFVVVNNQFTQVGRRGEVQAPAGAARVDLTGKTVMPTMVDLHGHLGFQNVAEGTMSKETFGPAWSSIFSATCVWKESARTIWTQKKTSANVWRNCSAK